MDSRAAVDFRAEPTHKRYRIQLQITKRKYPNLTYYEFFNWSRKRRTVRSCYLSIGDGSPLRREAMARSPGDGDDALVLTDGEFRSRRIGWLAALHRRCWSATQSPIHGVLAGSQLCTGDVDPPHLHQSTSYVRLFRPEASERRVRPCCLMAPGRKRTSPCAHWARSSKISTHEHICTSIIFT